MRGVMAIRKNSLARVVVFISGRGSNLLSLIENAKHYEVVGVICNRPQAAGIALARSKQVAVQVVDHQNYATREDFEAALTQEVAKFSPDYIALAGFMRRLTASFVAGWVGRIINIHPSLLPLYQGLNTHQRVIAAKDRRHGTSVHFVTAELDAGPVIAQAKLSVMPHESPGSLAERVLVLEHKLYPKVLSLLAIGKVCLSANKVLVSGVPQRSNGVEFQL